jgi:hypothetical protein
MRPSSARLLHTSVRISDLTFPASSILLPRTRVIFVHLDNLISFAKRDRDGQVDGYLVGYLPDEVVLLFFRRGELISAASIGSHGRTVTSIGEGLRRLKSDPEPFLFPLFDVAHLFLHRFFGGGAFSAPGPADAVFEAVIEAFFT